MSSNVFSSIPGCFVVAIDLQRDLADSAHIRDGEKAQPGGQWLNFQGATSQSHHAPDTCAVLCCVVDATLHKMKQSDFLHFKIGCEKKKKSQDTRQGWFLEFDRSVRLVPTDRQTFASPWRFYFCVSRTHPLVFVCFFPLFL